MDVKSEATKYLNDRIDRDGISMDISKSEREGCRHIYNLLNELDKTWLKNSRVEMFKISNGDAK